ncbi:MULTISPECIES: hypothetical protein [Sphingomonas]|nr:MULTISPECIES: hypothetical protein [Sphingomonas]
MRQGLQCSRTGKPGPALEQQSSLNRCGPRSSNCGWRKVADAVHAEGGRIVMQLWHVGRVSHPVFQPGGAAPVEPTAMDVPGKTFIIDADGNGA